MIKRIDEKQALELLKKYACSETAFKILAKHSTKVAKIAEKIAKQIPGVDIEFIKIASLLHDIGRFKYWSDIYPIPKDKRKQAVKHGIEGALILKSEGLPKHALVALRHIGGGITKQDIKELDLPLPLKDYMPITREEKIVAYADNLEDGENHDFNKLVLRYEKELGHRFAQRLIDLKNEIEEW